MDWILLNKKNISGSKGFGNTPISKENIGHKVLDIIDKAVNITDQRDEVMKMCLANSEVGDYQPVEVQGQPLQPSTMQASQTMKTSQRSQIEKPLGLWSSP